MTAGRPKLKVAVVPTASDRIEWVQEEKDGNRYTAKLIEEGNAKTSEDFLYLKNKDYDVMIADLKENPDKLREKLFNVDVICVLGGDVNYLLDWAKKSKLDNYLKDILDKDVLYVGISAGSCLLCPDIGLTWLEPNDSTDHVGLRIVDFVIVPHQKESDESQKAEEFISRKKYLQSFTDFPWKIYLLQDGQAVKVRDNKIEHIGEGMKISI